MTVYVDDMNASYRRMKMCHMIGTDEEELHRMAAAIGVARRWYQGDHYDVCLEMKRKAIALGAVPITYRQAGCLITIYKRTGLWIKPEDAIEAVRCAARERIKIKEGVIDVWTESSPRLRG